MKTIVINLFGGPGSGKSTIAAGVFYILKKKNINCELVREYVKKWAWEGILPNNLDQLYITGKQSKAEHMLYGKVEYIITDCPLEMGVFYDKKYNNSIMVENAVNIFRKQTEDKIEIYNFLVSRSKKYINNGRYCSMESAIKTDNELEYFLNNKVLGEYFKLSGSLDNQVKYILSVITR